MNAIERTQEPLSIIPITPLLVVPPQNNTPPTVSTTQKVFENTAPGFWSRIASKTVRFATSVATPIALYFGPKSPQAVATTRKKFDLIFDQHSPHLKTKVEDAIRKMVHTIVETTSHPSTVSTTALQAVLEKQYVQESLQDLMKECFSRIYGQCSVQREKICAVIGNSLEALTTTLKSSPEVEPRDPLLPKDLACEITNALLSAIFPEKANSLPTELLTSWLSSRKEWVYTSIQGAIQDQIQKGIEALLSEKVQDWILVNILDTIHAALNTGKQANIPWTFLGKFANSAFEGSFAKEVSIQQSNPELTNKINSFVDTCFLELLPRSLRIALFPIKAQLKERATASLMRFVYHVDLPRVFTNIFITTGETISAPTASEPAPTIPERPVDPSAPPPYQEGDSVNTKLWIEHLSNSSAKEALLHSISSWAPDKIKKSVGKALGKWPKILKWLKKGIKYVVTGMLRFVVHQVAKYNLQHKDSLEITKKLSSLFASKQVQHTIYRSCIQVSVVNQIRASILQNLIRETEGI